MITGNKGEWSEIYVLFKLLGDKELFSGDKIQNIVYPILKILRAELNGNFEYSIEDEIIVISGNTEVLRVSVNIFKEKAKYLLNQIKINQGTFAISDVEDFMKSINCFSLKANSSSKSDITIVIHDQRTGFKPALGFSIKSQLGNSSTLLNAGETTNFIYKIVNLSLNDLEIENINNISTKSKVKDRISLIFLKGGEFEFVNTQKNIFSNNLILIDSRLPQILSNLLLEFYSSNSSDIESLIKTIEMKNPLDFDVSSKHLFYSYKIKHLLIEIALGMMPSKVWAGQYDATGGYLVVKNNGDILCYHIYNKNDFENYLFKNTKLDTASSSRHGFGIIYKENNELYFKLNLQIRFK